MRLRIASQSADYPLTASVPADPAAPDSLPRGETVTVGACVVLSASRASCVAPNTSYPLLVKWDLTMDDPRYNALMVFTGVDAGPEYLYYRPPQLFAGDTAASSQNVVANIAVRYQVH